MGHFKATYKGHALDLPLDRTEMTLRASIGRWPGQRLDDLVTLEVSGSSQTFFFDPDGDEGEDSDWLSPCLNTQWLELPRGCFTAHDVRSLATVEVDFRGEGEPNALTGEAWREPPGLVCLYTNEFFRKAKIGFRHLEGAVFETAATGVTESGTTFDIAVSVPLTVALSAHKGEGTAEDLLAWFDTFLDRDDVAFEQSVVGQDVYLKGPFRG